MLWIVASESKICKNQRHRLIRQIKNMIKGAFDVQHLIVIKGKEDINWISIILKLPEHFSGSFWFPWYQAQTGGAAVVVDLLELSPRWWKHLITTELVKGSPRFLLIFSFLKRRSCSKCFRVMIWSSVGSSVDLMVYFGASIYLFFLEHEGVVISSDDFLHKYKPEWNYCKHTTSQSCFTKTNKSIKSINIMIFALFLDFLNCQVPSHIRSSCVHPVMFASFK